MSLRSIARLAAAFTSLAFAAEASATIITYDATNVGGSTWRYDDVTNDTLSVPLDELSFYFRLGAFEDLQSIDAPASQPVDVFPIAGFTLLDSGSTAQAVVAPPAQAPSVRVPEPGTLALLAAGLAFMALRWRDHFMSLKAAAQSRHSFE